MAIDGLSIGTGLTSDWHRFGDEQALDEIGMGRRVIGTGLSLDWCIGLSSDWCQIGVRLESDWDRLALDCTGSMSDRHQIGMDWHSIGIELTSERNGLT